ncbi:MAG: hypothetical protein AVDCRST_MAG27-4256, partial [uncultured Craurococcus sp.]
APTPARARALAALGLPRPGEHALGGERLPRHPLEDALQRSVRHVHAAAEARAGRRGAAARAYGDRADLCARGPLRRRGGGVPAGPVRLAAGGQYPCRLGGAGGGADPRHLPQAECLRRGTEILHRGGV